MRTKLPDDVSRKIFLENAAKLYGVAIPDEQWGERPKAFVTLKKGQEATEQEIIDYCKEHIARFKAPAAVEFTDLPKTSTGKVQKYELRTRAKALTFPGKASDT